MSTFHDITTTGAVENMDAVDRALHNERNGYSSFDADYTPSPEAIEKVNAVFDYIEKNPEKWEQDTYGDHNSRTNCFMGLVCRLDGIETERVSGTDIWGDPYAYNREYHLDQAMDILGMDGDQHQDRAQYIAHFIEKRDMNGKWVEVTLNDMRERVSIALTHDFRKPKALNDPTVDCCGRDAADCDCN